MSKYWQKVGYLFTLLLPLSLLLSEKKLPGIPAFLGLTGAVSITIFVLFAREYHLEDIGQFWKRLHPLLRLSISLMALGVIGGVLFSGGVAFSVRCALLWFVLPVLASWFATRDRARTIWLERGILLYVLGLLFAKVIFHRFELSSAVLASISVPVVLYSVTRWKVALWNLGYSGIIIGLLACADGLSAVVAVCGILCVWLFKHFRAERYLLIVIPLLLFSVFTVVFSVGGGSEMVGQKRVIHERFEVWKTSIYISSVYPLSGAGLGQYEPAYRLNVNYALPTSTVPTPRDSGNIYLDFWINLGAAGILGLVGVLVWAILYGRDSAARVSLISLYVLGVFFSVYFTVQMAFLFWMFLFLNLRKEVASD